MNCGSSSGVLGGVINGDETVSVGEAHHAAIVQAAAVAAAQNSTAFWNPKIWDKTSSSDDDFKLEYMDLDEFLTENDLPIETVLQEQLVDGRKNNIHHQQQNPPLLTQQQTHQHDPENVIQSPLSTSQPHIPVQLVTPQPNVLTHVTSDSKPIIPETFMQPQAHQQLSQQRLSKCNKRQNTSSPTLSTIPNTSSINILGQNNNFCGSPTTPISLAYDEKLGRDGSSFSSINMFQDSLDLDIKPQFMEDLKPAQVVRKRKKQMVSEDCKDEKYWERRRKNNMAAKRSRDARRAKENQIAVRAGFLERENKALVQELSKARADNHLLRERLCKYEVV